MVHSEEEEEEEENDDEVLIVLYLRCRAPFRRSCESDCEKSLGLVGIFLV